jgi:hypothetical protein
MILKKNTQALIGRIPQPTSIPAEKTALVRNMSISENKLTYPRN